MKKAKEIYNLVLLIVMIYMGAYQLTKLYVKAIFKLTDKIFNTHYFGTHVMSTNKKEKR